MARTHLRHAAVPSRGRQLLRHGGHDVRQVSLQRVPVAQRAAQQAQRGGGVHAAQQAQRGVRVLQEGARQRSSGSGSALSQWAQAQATPRGRAAQRCNHALQPLTVMLRGI